MKIASNLLGIGRQGEIVYNATRFKLRKKLCKIFERLLKFLITLRILRLLKSKPTLLLESINEAGTVTFLFHKSMTCITDRISIIANFLISSIF